MHSSGREPKLDWSARGRLRVILWTVLGTIGCVSVTLYLDHFNFMLLAPEDRARSIATDVLVPIILAGPLLFAFTNKIRQLAVIQAELQRIASTDSLTGVFSRGAFFGLVEAYLDRAQAQALHGGLLIIDADHFKNVNDRFGHDQGDEALRLMAGAIGNVLRGADVVGRIGGEEFGVFLPGADRHVAEATAERIRVSVSSTEFRPADARHDLTVSVGGAVFHGPVPFAELYREADRQLYAAKERGRNRVVVATVEAASAAVA